MAASLTDTASTRDEAVEKADNFSAQLTASVRREDVYRARLAAVKDDLARTRVERANLRC